MRPVLCRIHRQRPYGCRREPQRLHVLANQQLSLATRFGVQHSPCRALTAFGNLARSLAPKIDAESINRRTEQLQPANARAARADRLDVHQGNDATVRQIPRWIWVRK
jgi:Fe-S-cluster containining protein